MIRRTITVDLYFECCLEGKPRGIKHTIHITLHDEAEEFDTSLVIWGDRFVDIPEIHDYIIGLGDNKCKVISPSLEICKEEISVIDVIGEEIT